MVSGRGNLSLQIVCSRIINAGRMEEVSIAMGFYKEAWKLPVVYFSTTQPSQMEGES
jgi:hypothetical protein